MTDERKPEERQEKDPDLKRPDEAVADLEPDEHDSLAVKGGTTPPVGWDIKVSKQV